MNIEEALKTHSKTVEVSGGGAMGTLDAAKLDSVLNHIQNDEYYPTFEDKMTHLFFGACKFHCFQDGNKRIAISLCAQFLLLNGYVFLAADFIRKMENISYHVASGSIDKELLHEIISSVISGLDDDESLKLKIWNAISQDEDASI